MMRDADPFGFTGYEIILDTREKADEIVLALRGIHPDQDKINASI